MQSDGGAADGVLDDDWNILMLFERTGVERVALIALLNVKMVTFLLIPFSDNNVRDHAQ